MVKKTIIWSLFAFMAIGVGLYPAIYLVLPQKVGLLNIKPVELLESNLWNIAFYQHILLGAIALFSGWSQFSKKLRTHRIKLHRNLGKVYILAVLLSGLAGLYLAFYATGGKIAAFGFGTLAVLWLYTTGRAYHSISHKAIDSHRQWMIRSYALCFAAVTLRIWLPFLQTVAGFDFIFSYKIVAWLCWVPNLIFAEWVTRKGNVQKALA